MKKYRAVLMQADSAWLAQCVDLDIVARGETAEEAAKILGLTIQSDLNHCKAIGKEPLDAIGPGPAHVQEMWDNTQWQYIPGATSSDVEYRMSA